MDAIVKALVVDDHPLLAHATRDMLHKTGEIDVVSVVGTGTDCLEQVRVHEPGLIFLDYQLPATTGTELTKIIKAEYPHIHIIIFTGVDYMEFYDQLVEAGVSGVLSKESGIRTIRNMVWCVLDNHTMLPMPMYHQLRLGNRHMNDPHSKLDQEELNIMNMLLKGATYDQIADNIHMSRRTVDNYMKRIFEKMGVKNRLEAIEAFLVKGTKSP